jgi:DNA-binding NtrC family response regulator
MSAHRILIVDDEPTLIFFLRQELLEANLNLEVDGVGSGEEALAKLAYDQYSLLVTDLKMPGINGLTLAVAARSLQPAIGVILMTAHGSREIESEAEQIEVDGYLTKPFPVEKLRDMVQAVLEARQQPVPATTSNTRKSEQAHQHHPPASYKSGG